MAVQDIYFIFYSVVLGKGSQLKTSIFGRSSLEKGRAAGDWCLLILLRCQRSHEWVAYGCQTGTFHNVTHIPSR